MVIRDFLRVHLWSINAYIEGLTFWVKILFLSVDVDYLVRQPIVNLASTWYDTC
jgi:hypothetical protein